MGIATGSAAEAIAHSMIKTISFRQYAAAYSGLLSTVRAEAKKLVAIEIVLNKSFDVPSHFNMK